MIRLKSYVFNIESKNRPLYKQLHNKSCSPGSVCFMQTQERTGHKPFMRLSTKCVLSTQDSARPCFYHVTPQ